jgi:hypothetical protein
MSAAGLAGMTQPQAPPRRQLGRPLRHGADGESCSDVHRSARSDDEEDGVWWGKGLAGQIKTSERNPSPSSNDEIGYHFSRYSRAASSREMFREIAVVSMLSWPSTRCRLASAIPRWKAVTAWVCRPGCGVTFRAIFALLATFLTRR